MWLFDVMQLGLEVGEMSPRRAGIQQQRVQCLSSDADYTSSSEQSCDTVIYVGKNGRVLSDRELTDNEGPPAASKPTVSAAATTPSPGTQSSTPAPAKCSSEICGDSCTSGGMIIASPPPAVNVVVDSSSAHGCVGQSQHRRELLASCHRVRGTAADSRHGDVTIKGESAVKSSSAADCSNTSTAAAEKLRKTPASRRADGCAAGVVECWIDGPRSADVEAVSVAATVGGTADDSDAGAGAAELWVDGPAEFQRDPASLVESARSPMKLRKSKCAKLYRARAAAVAAAAADSVDVDTTTSKRAPATDNVETTRKDVDISAIRQFAVDPLRLKGSDQTRLLTNTAMDSVAAYQAVMTEELGRWRAHRRSSGRKPTTTTTNHVTLASFYSPDRCAPASARAAPDGNQGGPDCAPGGPASAQSSPAHRLRLAGGRGVQCGDRTAQWVRSVQVAAAGVAPSQFSQRPMSPLKSQSVDRVLRGCGVDLRPWQDCDSASDDAITAVSNNSPPPDYATCVAADLERRRCRRIFTSPTSNHLDINENLQATNAGTSGAPPPHLKLLPVSSLTPLHVAAAPYLYGVVPQTFAGVQVEPAANARRPTSGCHQEQPEAVFDSSTWPRRQDGGGGSVMSFPALDMDGEELTSTPCKRLHHPDGASNPQLSEEVSRRSDDVDAVDCCKLLTLLNADNDSTSTSTRRQCSCQADAVDVLKCRSALLESSDAPPAALALSPACMRLAAHEDAIRGLSNFSQQQSDSDRSTTTTRPIADTVRPPVSSNPTKAVPSTRLKAPASTASKTASPKRNKSSSGVSLLWCIHPRGSSKSRSSKSGHRQAEVVCLDGDRIGHERQATDTQWLAAESALVADRSTDSDRGSSLSECTPPTALEQARRLCSGDDDDDDDADNASSDYWSGKASADQLPSTPRLAITSTHHADGHFRLPFYHFVFFLLSSYPLLAAFC